MSEKKKSKLSDLNLLGIPIDPTLGVGDKVLDHIDESIEEEKKKEAASKYWARCPSCRKKVIRGKNQLKKVVMPVAGKEQRVNWRQLRQKEKVV